MSEYRAPGVYVEETSFRSKSIEGVSTTTTGFIGPTRYGPIDLEPEIVTSLGEFERTYGDRQQLTFSDQKEPMHNWMWHAARAFFEEGGKRLYIARVFNGGTNPENGFARAVLPEQALLTLAKDETFESRLPNALHFRARFPGKPGNRRVRLILRMGQNVLGGEPGKPTVAALQPGDVVWVSGMTSPISRPPGSERFYIAEPIVDPNSKQRTWQFRDSSTSPDEIVTLADLTPGVLEKDPSDLVRVVTLTATVDASDELGSPGIWDGLPLDPTHKFGMAPHSAFDKFAGHPQNLTQARTLPIVITRGINLETGLDVLNVLCPDRGQVRNALVRDGSTDAERSIDLDLNGGHDGARPTAGEYEGDDNPDAPKRGLKIFEDVEDISIVAAPGSTFRNNGYEKDARRITSLLISHAQKMRYRIAVLDSGDGQSISEVRAFRAKYNSSYAALYYPWIRILDPVTRQEVNVPPSGAVAGIYARNDINRAVYKAPSNEVVSTALGFEALLNTAQQEVLNLEGINCFRFFEGRGRLLGARTISSDPEWKYVNLRRYFAYVERSIDKGTQWAVFEPDGEALWANVRRTIEDFLLNEWQSGALPGDKQETAYFVKCDRSTMTQNDLDNGRLICLIGVALLRPAEFVIFRIGQWTADRKT
jgi:phage tail sheath protein FI